MTRLALPVLLLAFVACQRAGIPPPFEKPEEVGTVPAPTPMQAANATYTGITDEAITLSDGAWAGEPVAPGAPLRPGVILVPGFRLTGLVGSGAAEKAVVLLSFSSGGSGEDLYLAVLDSSGGLTRDLGTVHLGHNVKIREARIENREIVLDVLQPGPDDAMCCPGELATRTFDLGPTGLREVSSRVTGRLSLETLDGTEWVLRRFDDELAPDAPEVTMEVMGSRFGGSAGCNRYGAEVTPEGQPGDIRVGNIQMTRKMCPENVMAVETRYLRGLRDVSKFSFLTGELVLLTADDAGNVGSLSFVRRGS